ncbi:MAG: CPBP family intramembrane metalloprotease [Patescibacteria group bacterium]|nr:CPBP family intramembrane metalloprotease [Patescibacteria group bacterium]
MVNYGSLKNQILILLSPLGLIAGMVFFQISGLFPPLLFYAIWAVFSPIVIKRKLSFSVYREFGLSFPDKPFRSLRILLIFQFAVSFLLISLTGRFNPTLILFTLLISPFLLFSPLIEEIYWRGVLLKAFNEHWVGVKAIVAGYFSFLFWSYHFLLFGLFNKPLWLSPTMFILAFFAGLVWSFFYYRTKSLLYPYLSHLLADILLVYFLEPIFFK